MSKVFELGFGETRREITAQDLPVRGKIPEWLAGSLIRNGPGTFHVGEQTYRHWFDGLAMLHKFSFAGGRVSYANKFLDCQAYRSAKETGRISYSEFATDPCRNLFGRAMTVFSPKITDSAKVSVAQIGGHYLALAETPIQVEFDPHTLQSAGVFTFENTRSGQMTTVHPTFDASRGEVYNVVTRYHQTSHYNVYQMHGVSKPRRVASVPVSQPAYMHSFGMSQNYIILAEFPLVVNPLALLLWLKPYIENFKWKPGRGTQFHVIHRGTGQVVARLEADPFFAFHHVNAFEQGDEIVLDIDAYTDASILNAYYLDRLKDEQLRLPHGTLRRYRLPLKGKRATYETISEACMELPSFDKERYTMRPDYRYVYACGLSREQPTGFYNQIIKVDIQTRQEKTWRQPGCYPGEAVFVPRPGGTAEDDGVLLSVVLDSLNGGSFLLALNAATMEEIGRSEIPHPVLIGYHGDFFPGV